MASPQIDQPTQEGGARDTRAILLIVTAMVAFAIQDAFVKKIVEVSPVWQAQLIRSILVLGLLWLIAVSIGKRRELWPTQWFWPIARGGFMCGAYVLFYASLPFLSLSQASASFFIGPMLIALFAAVLLSEPIGPRRMIAIVVGFIGVLCIVRPGGDMNLAALMPVGAAFCYALGVVVTRWRCRADPAFSLSMVHNGVYTVVAILAVSLIGLIPFTETTRDAYPALTNGWGPLPWLIFGLLVVTAFTHIIGMQTSVRAYQLSDASKIAPFEYTYLAIVPILDFVVWQTLPTALTILGMVLIAGSGGFVAWREGRPARARPQNYGEVPWSEDSDSTPPPNEGK